MGITKFLRAFFVKYAITRKTAIKWL